MIRGIHLGCFLAMGCTAIIGLPMIKRTIQPQMIGEGFMPIDHVCILTSKSKPTIYRWAKSGLFPAPVRLGPNSVGFRVEQVRAWLVDPASWQIGEDK